MALGGLLSIAKASNPDTFFQTKSVIIPKDASIERGGEDSADNAEKLICVADGVGGWINRGVDSGLFSRALTQAVIDVHESDKSAPAKELLKYACQSATDTNMGSATAIVLKLDGLTIESAQLGDSGFSVFRAGEDNHL